MKHEKRKERFHCHIQISMYLMGIWEWVQSLEWIVIVVVAVTIVVVAVTAVVVVVVAVAVVAVALGVAVAVVGVAVIVADL